MPPRKKIKTEVDAAPAPRRSTRAKTVKVEQTKSEDDPDSDPSLPPKRGTTAVARRQGHRHIRGRRGGLADMPNMPLDVLIEIFGFLHPRDLLCLARTTREFRAFLMSRTKSLAFWKASRKQIEGLPDIPAPLSEPAYANLLFFNHCHGCLKTTGSPPAMWHLLVRYCNSCRNTMLRTCARIAAIDVQKEISSWIDPTLFMYHDVLARGRYYDDIRYSRSDLDAFLQLWNDMKDATTDEKKQFIEDRKALVVERKKIAQQLQTWEDSVKAQQDAAKKAMKEDRFMAVLDKLREEGWGEELDMMERAEQSRLYDIPGVCRPTKLTERAWSNMRTQAIECMKTIRAKRVEVEYRDMIRERLRYLKKAVHNYTHAELLQSKDRLVYATLMDCALIPEIRAILEDTYTSQEDCEEQMVTQLDDMLPALVARWTEQRKSELSALMVKQLGDRDAARVADPLNLAIAHFKCRSCHSYGTGSYMRFPEILGHHCFKTRLEVGIDSFRNALVFASPSESTIVNTASPYLAVESDIQKSVKIMRQVIEACGRNADIVTFAEMKACDARLRCLLCAQVSQQTIFTWESAIEHTAARSGHNHLSEREEEQVIGFWERVPEEHAAIARRALETASVEVPIAETDSSYYHEDAMCMWCCTRASVGTLKHHLKSIHGIEEPQANVDFFLRDKPRDSKVTMYSHIYSKIPSKIAAVKAGKAFFASF